MLTCNYKRTYKFLNIFQMFLRIFDYKNKQTISYVIINKDIVLIAN